MRRNAIGPSVQKWAHEIVQKQMKDRREKRSRWKRAYGFATASFVALVLFEILNLHCGQGNTADLTVHVRPLGLREVSGPIAPVDEPLMG
jgi:hypothetical protein